MSDNGQPTRRSAAITEGPSRAPARAMLKAVGFTDADLRRPIIGVANTWIEIGPCNFHLRRLGDDVKAGIPGGRGTPMEFNTVSISDGITMGSEGMRTSLVSREVVADSIELVARGNLFDGLVILVGCDKTIPGGVMALVRLNIPGLILYGGSIAPGRWEGHDVTIQDVFEAVGAHAAGKITDAQLCALEDSACPGPGACGGQFTANTMSTVCELLGVSPMSANAVPAWTRSRMMWPAAPARSSCVWCRRRATEADRHARCPRERIASVALTGGSTNAVLHLLAIAREADVSLDLGDFDRINQQVPLLADLKPGGRFVATDLYQAGGIGLVAHRLRELGVLHGAALTVTGTDRRRRSRGGPGDAGSRSGAHALGPDKAYRGAGGAQGQPRPRWLRGQGGRPHDDETTRARARLRHRGGGVRRGGAGPHPGRRRGRDPIRGSAGWSGDARDVGGDGCARGRGVGRVGGAAHRRPLLGGDPGPDGRSRRARSGDRRTDRGSAGGGTRSRLMLQVGP